VCSASLCRHRRRRVCRECCGSGGNRFTTHRRARKDYKGVKWVCGSVGVYTHTHTRNNDRAVGRRAPGHHIVAVPSVRVGSTSFLYNIICIPLRNRSDAYFDIILPTHTHTHTHTHVRARARKPISVCVRARRASVKERHTKSLLLSSSV